MAIKSGDPHGVSAAELYCSITGALGVEGPEQP